jgi:hypothetical protein
MKWVVYVHPKGFHPPRVCPFIPPLCPKCLPPFSLTYLLIGEVARWGGRPFVFDLWPSLRLRSLASLHVGSLYLSSLGPSVTWFIRLAVSSPHDTCREVPRPLVVNGSHTLSLRHRSDFVATLSLKSFNLRSSLLRGLGLPLRSLFLITHEALEVYKDHHVAKK